MDAISAAFFLTTGERFVKNTSSYSIKLITLLFYPII